MNDNTQMNDNWVPINLQIPMDNKFMDLSETERKIHFIQ